jgi:Mrp family chromosome partitioning ATPase
MRQLLTMLRQYDENLVVIFDMPPILGCDDVAAVSEMMDGALLVVSEGETTRDELKRVGEALGDTPLLATVMNRSTEADFERYYY